MYAYIIMLTNHSRTGLTNDSTKLTTNTISLLTVYSCSASHCVLQITIDLVLCKLSLYRLIV